MKITVLHETIFEYARPVHATYTEARLKPVTDEFQTCHEFSLTVDPMRPLMVAMDYYGSTVHSFNILPPHQHVVVTARSIVETHRESAGQSPVPEFEARRAHLDYLRFDGPVEDVPDIEDLVDASALRHAPNALGAVEKLNALIRDRFTFAPLSTDVHAKISQVFENGSGVCQDFAHIFIAACRAAGLPARYVSGYLVTRQSRLAQGAPAAHAWAEVLLPEHGWCGFDPTNNMLTDDFYIKVAAGRDYRDASPTHGTYRGGPVESQFRVRVHTTVHDENAGSVLDTRRELVG